MSERFAIYYAPDAHDPLWLKAAEWLGRDPLTGDTFDAPLPGIARADLLPRSESPRRYGFHATIKAPMALAPDKKQAELEAALAAYAERTAPVAMGPIKLALIEGFLALVPAVQSTELTALCGEIVATFDPYRAPLSPEGRAKRIANGRLDARQVELLDSYGYPYVLEQFQLHMTLTERLAADEQEAYRQAAATHFGALAGADMVLDRLSLFHEPEPGAPFVRLDDYVFKG